MGEQTQQYDNSALRQTSIEQNTIKKLDGKVDTLEGNIEKSITETHQKVEKMELDELKNGIEKERSKINYFQDKISNIAKSVDGVKIEVNNMRDKFCSDIECHDE